MFTYLILVLNQSWIKGARYYVEGVVYKYEIGSDSEKYTKIKQGMPCIPET